MTEHYLTPIKCMRTFPEHYSQTHGTLFPGVFLHVVCLLYEGISQAAVVKTMVLFMLFAGHKDLLYVFKKTYIYIYIYIRRSILRDSCNDLEGVVYSAHRHCIALRCAY